MIRSDKVCHSALNQCLHILKDVQQYLSSQPAYSTENATRASKEVRLALDTFVYEQKAAKRKERMEQLKKRREERKDQNIFVQLRDRLNREDR